jgi:hypothetical protein
VAREVLVLMVAMPDPSKYVRTAFIRLRNRSLSEKTRPFANSEPTRRCYAARVLEAIARSAAPGGAAVLLAMLACSSRTAGAGFAGFSSNPGDVAGNPASDAGGAGVDAAAPTVVSDASTWTLGDASSVAAGACPYHDSLDHDGDGFSSTLGDCNDCNPDINPGAFDVPHDGIDEDCDGIIDDEPTGCDTSVVLDSSSAADAARAIDLCRTTTEDAVGKARTWGVIAATFVAPDGTDQCTTGGDAPGISGWIGGGTTGTVTSCVGDANFDLGHGNLSKLGVVEPRVGVHMLGLSSGTARDPTDPGYSDVSGFDKGFTVNAAAGFPAPAPACPNVITGQPHDGAALLLTLRVPTNAESFSFSENFFSYEFPGYICSTYNDTFVVEMTPAPPAAPDAAIAVGGDIAFDQSGNPICVNNSLLQVCDPQTAGGKTFACPLGPSQLQGTGFGADTTGGTDHAATGWLTTTVNVDASLRGRDVTLLFAIWDSGDGIYDSTALIDGFTWSTAAGKTTPVTQPSPVQ